MSPPSPLHTETGSPTANPPGIPAFAGNGMPPGATDDPAAATTGRYLVVYADELAGNDDQSRKQVLQTLKQKAGIKSMLSAEAFSTLAMAGATEGGAEATFFPALGVALVQADMDQIRSLDTASTDSNSPILLVEPEYVMHALGDERETFRQYLKGYRDAVNHVYAQLFEHDEEALEAALVFRDNAQFTWGLQATGCHVTRATGAGIKVAVLDTGIDLAHPDFQARQVTFASFIPGSTVQDRNGHGTHCAGTACGPSMPHSGVRRYGCAPDAHLYVGKVLADNGSSVSGSVLEGMNWAVTERCQVISMSLGSDVRAVSGAFETIGRRALEQGCLIVAAAGNNAQRSRGNAGFVGQPANSPSIMAVSALDSGLRVADFSARSNEGAGAGGRVDIAGPGVAVFSSVPGATGREHDALNGTSMAAPHVAGIAALWSQASGTQGRALWTVLTQHAQALRADMRDVGAGLVKAP